jgi:hypothetical protein
VIRMVNRLGSMNRMDSVDSIVETSVHGGAGKGGKDPGKAVTDPGHVLGKFNCAAGPTQEGVAAKRYEFAIETSVGPSIFHRTKVGNSSSLCDAIDCRSHEVYALGRVVTTLVSGIGVESKAC